MNLSKYAKGLVVLGSLFMLASCGGGSGGGTVSTAVSVSPALGCFEDGAEVQALDLSGTQLAKGTVRACKAPLDLGAHTGPFILKVLAGKKYFDERTGDWSAVAYSGDGLLSVVPAVTKDKAYGINLITHMVAAQAGVDPASPKLEGASNAVDLINAAKTEVLSFLGLSENDLGGDVFATPPVLDGSNPLTGELTGLKLYAAVLADLAAESTTSPADQAKELYDLVKQAKAASGAEKAALLVSLSNSVVGSVNRVVAGTSAVFTSAKLSSGATKPTGIDLSQVKAKAQETIQASTGEKVNLASGSQEVAKTVVTTAGIVVVPDLGRFSKGAVVEAYDPVTGSRIQGATGLTDEDGVAALELGGYKGSVVLKVTGGAGVSYYDEGQAKGVDFAAGDTLIGLIPASSIKNNTRYSVNPLTHVAAAFAGLSSSNLKLTVQGTDTAETVIYKALARTRLMLGLSAVPINELEARVMLNPLVATTPLSSATVSAGVDTSKAGGYWSVFFGELAEAALGAGHLLQPNVWELTKATAAELLSLSGNYASFSNSNNAVKFKDALVAVGEGNSNFLGKCQRLSAQLSTKMDARFKDPGSRISLEPSAAEIEEVVDELKLSIGSFQNNGRSPASFDSTALNTCPK